MAEPLDLTPEQAARLIRGIGLKCEPLKNKQGFWLLKAGRAKGLEVTSECIVSLAEEMNLQEESNG